MSVINNVLKDLEARESGFKPIDIAPVAAPESAGIGAKTILIAALLLVAAATLWTFWQQPFLAAKVPAPELANATTVVEAMAMPATELASASDALAMPAAAASAPETVQPNQIVGLQIHETEQEMRLEFLLREKVVAYLKARGESSFGYHMRATESQIIAPTINDNRWIESLAIVTGDRGVDINFETAADILVETRQVQIDGQPAWAISLKKSLAENRLTDKPVIAETPTRQNAPPTAVVEISEPLPVLSETVMAPEPAGTSPKIEKAEVRLEIKSTNPNARAINQLDYALQLINSGRLAEAEALLRDQLDGSEDYRARQHLLALYGRQNRADRFARLVRESAIAYPQDQLFQSEYARVLFQGGAYRSVLEMFAGERDLDATQLALVAASHQRLEQHASAVEYYQLALAQDAANARNWIALGISQEHSSAFEDALISYRRAGQLGNLTARLQAFVERKSDTLEQVLN